MKLTAAVVLLWSLAPAGVSAHPGVEVSQADGTRTIVHEEEEGNDHCMHSDLMTTIPCPAEAPAKAKPLFRMFDGTNQEMRALAVEYFGQGPCGHPGETCPEAQLPVASGGNDLARYLISHYEAEKREGYGLNGTVLVTVTVFAGPSRIQAGHVPPRQHRRIVSSGTFVQRL